MHHLPEGHFHHEHEQFSHKKSWFKRAKQRVLEFFHDSRDRVTDAQSSIKNYSNTAVQKIVDKPVPYLIAASAVGFLLSSLFHHHYHK